jgi:hypothetical protein
MEALQTYSGYNFKAKRDSIMAVGAGAVQEARISRPAAAPE